MKVKDFIKLCDEYTDIKICTYHIYCAEECDDCWEIFECKDFKETIEDITEFMGRAKDCPAYLLDYKIIEIYSQEEIKRIGKSKKTYTTHQIVLRVK